MSETKFYNAVAIATKGSYARLAQLYRQYGTWEYAYEALRALELLPFMPNPEEAQEKLNRSHIELILRSDDRYPSALREIHRPPFGLYIKGDPSTLCRYDTTIAIVGTRRATREGRDIAQEFARDIADASFTIASGLAFGIDSAAHEGCLNAQGMTIAVLASGLDNVYPRSNTRLAARILESHGTLVSEYPFGESSLPYRFIERNRIISGLSRGVVVIEAPKGSGSLATARFAVEQGRDVFVLPGNVAHANFKGSHELIRQGALLITHASDVLEEYGIDTAAQREKNTESHSREETLVLTALKESSGALEVDKIIQMTRLEPRIAVGTISFLLIKELIKETEEGYTI